MAALKGTVFTMADDPEFFSVSRLATADRPLAGLTVLLVEDSRFASEAMRLLCLRSGARIRRADSLRAARRHLAIYRPAVVIVDMGLPDGSGAELICELARAHPPAGIILGISGDPDEEGAARDAGATGFLTKPLTSLDAFQQAVIAALPTEDRPSGLRALGGGRVQPDPIALHDDLSHVADMLSTTDGAITERRARLEYIAQFLRVLARDAGDTDLEAAARSLDDVRKAGGRYGPPLARIAGLVQDRLGHRDAV